MKNTLILQLNLIKICQLIKTCLMQINIFTKFSFQHFTDYKTQKHLINCLTLIIVNFLAKKTCNKLNN